MILAVSSPSEILLIDWLSSAISLVLILISIINNILDSIFINHDKTAYILQRDNLYKKNGIYKDGIHIIYPEIVGKYNILYLIRKILLDQLKWLETYSITLIDEIIDVYKFWGMLNWNSIIYK